MAINLHIGEIANLALSHTSALDYGANQARIFLTFINLHIGEIANLGLLLIGIFLSFKNRKKTHSMLRVKVTRFLSLWQSALFAGMVCIAAIFFGINEILVLLALLYFVIENRILDISPGKGEKSPISPIYERNGKWLQALGKGSIHTVKVWPILFMAGWSASLLLEGYEVQDSVRDLQNAKADDMGTRIIKYCILAPITEELIFRGMIYPLFKKSMGVFWACVISSLIFSFIHYNILSFSMLFVFSCCLTYIYERSNNILVPMASHSIFNGIMIILILLK